MVGFYAHFCFLMLVFLLVGNRSVCAEESPPSVTITLARQQELSHLLKHDCGSCHGLTLLGGLGPPMTVTALQDKPANQLEETILHGIPKTAMPPWRDHLTPQEARWLVDRLKKGLTQ